MTALYYLGVALRKLGLAGMAILVIYGLGQLLGIFLNWAIPLIMTNFDLTSLRDYVTLFVLFIAIGAVGEYLTENLPGRRL